MYKTIYFLFVSNVSFLGKSVCVCVCVCVYIKYIIFLN